MAKKPKPSVLLNKAQLARRLNLALQTLNKRIAAGLFTPVSVDGNGRQLFTVPEGR